MKEERFKFRMWSNRLNRFLGQSPCIGLENGFFADIHTLEDNQVIEQSTGIKDKTGKLIFEGDIIAWGECLRVVCWDKSAAAFKLKRYSGENGILESIIDNKIDDAKIVGNIHGGEYKE